MEYDVFISCKSEDYKYAEDIYYFLSQQGINAFLASTELRKIGKAEYRSAISKALKVSYHMIVFASKAEYIDSTWVYYEWDLFINAKLSGAPKGQIITILKDVKVNEINLDLCKYESFSFEGYRDYILPYIETPNYIQRQEKIKKESEEKRRKEILEENKRKEERLKSDITEVEKLIVKIESDESSLLSDRLYALKKISCIDDSVQQQRLFSILDSTGSIHKSHTLKLDELQEAFSNERSALLNKIKCFKKEKRLHIFILCLSFIATFILCFTLLHRCYNSSLINLNSKLEKDYSKLEKDYSKLEKDYSSLTVQMEQYDYREFNNYKLILTENLPFIVTDIKLGNRFPTGKGGGWETAPGEQIKSINTFYLAPQIECLGIIQGDYCLNYKLYYNSELSENKKNNKGYTSSSTTINPPKGKESSWVLHSWGGDTQGYWPSGNYRVEIWYNNLCLKSKEFKIE